MTLVVITDCLHFKLGNNYVNKNPVFTRQLDSLFEKFDSISLLFPVDQFPLNDEGQASYYMTEGNKLLFVPLPNAGGNGLFGKLTFLRAIPVWIYYFMKYRRADFYYLRFPNNINILSFLYFRMLSKRIFITYTGTWRDYKGEPWTYRLQKKLMIRYLDGPGFIYSQSSRTNLNSTFSPSFSSLDIKRISEKVILTKFVDGIGSDHKLVLLNIGKIIEYKNQLLSIRLVEELVKLKVNVELRIVGEGGLYSNNLRDFVAENALADNVKFLGYLNRVDLEIQMQSAHFLIHTPRLEGFGKTPLEGMQFGLIPVLSKFPYSSFFSGENGERGFEIDENSIESTAKLITESIQDYSKMRLLMERCIAFASDYTIEKWRDDIMEKLGGYNFRKS